MSEADDNRVALVVGGVSYTGWKSVTVQRSVEQMAGAFNLGLTHRWPGQGATPELRENLPCQVLVGDDVVNTGYIDALDIDVSGTACSIQVDGRDKTGDLVDCSAIYRAGQWLNAPLTRIVNDLIEPFKLKLVLQEGLKEGNVFSQFALEDGETVFAAIDRACRLRGVLCSSTANGDVWLGIAGAEHSGATLEEGVNLLRCKSKHSTQDRFSQIIVKAQVPGSDDFTPSWSAQQKAQATDAEIGRYRPLVVHAEQGDSAASLKTRAAWEVQVRMGRGKRGQATVVGWRCGKDGQTGKLWQPNTLVRVVSPRNGLDRDVLIVSCTFTLDARGMSTVLDFVLPEAFQLVDGLGMASSSLKGNLKDQTLKAVKTPSGVTGSWSRSAPAQGGR